MTGFVELEGLFQVRRPSWRLIQGEALEGTEKGRGIMPVGGAWCPEADGACGLIVLVASLS
jgi:hypothetical protein